MYCNKESVNILTALLVAHGVRHAVVCPGSRNAPIVHNLNECPDIHCYPVTDERSAGFYALGMMQALHAPVVVCVTSGTALLNLAPAVAEAYYQHQPLIVISADRPPQWIDQLDGQTLPQPGALGRFVSCSVSLPEIPLFEEGANSPSAIPLLWEGGARGGSDLSWHCSRLVNESLLTATSDDARPVHINVPITEPLFTFDVPRLPEVRSIIRTSPTPDYGCLHEELVEGLSSARRPMIVIGQVNPHDFEGNGVDFLFSHVIVLHESLSPFPSVSHFDEVLALGDKNVQRPDFILYVGDTIVSKRLRHFLRSATDAVTWRISRLGDVEDTFQNLRGIVVGDPEQVLQSLSQKLSHRHCFGMEYRRQWLSALAAAARHADEYQPPYSQMAAVKYFESKVQERITFNVQRSARPKDACKARTFNVHYANSSAIRLANIYAHHYVWCNRGVNGIEGSLSTAAGFSVVTDEKVFCVIGDLSFFYDQNALWNQNLRGNLRILLLNNGRGGIFSMLPGLAQSPVADSFVAGAHTTTAEGICRQNNIVYLKADDEPQMQQGIDTLLTLDSPRPVLLEVLTNPHADTAAMRQYWL